MKYLTIPRLSTLSTTLSSLSVSDQNINARLEAYSCKPAGDDKRIGKAIERACQLELSTSPVDMTETSLGNMHDSNTRKLLINLITTMNAAFPDYDFSNLRPDQFEHLRSTQQAMESVNSLFLNNLEPLQPGIRSEVWSAIDQTIDMQSCEAYCWTPDIDADMSVGKLWSVNTFFYNRKDKKILFFTAFGQSKMYMAEEDTDESDEMDLMNESSEYDEEEHHSHTRNDNEWNSLDWEDAPLNPPVLSLTHSSGQLNEEFNSRIIELDDNLEADSKSSRRKRSAGIEKNIRNLSDTAQRRRKKRTADTVNPKKSSKNSIKATSLKRSTTTDEIDAGTIAMQIASPLVRPIAPVNSVAAAAH